jgi:hypothetical protein
VALDSRGSAAPRRLHPQARVGGPAVPAGARLRRGVAWGLLFAAPVWLLLLGLAVWVVHLRG